MKKVLFLVRTAPYGSAAIPESVRACLGFGTMPMEVSYVLMDDATWALAPGQRPESIGASSVQTTLAALGGVDVEVLVEAEALAERGLTAEGAGPGVRAVSGAQIADLVAAADVVMTY